MNVYAFRIAYQSADELAALQKQLDFNPDTLVTTILPDGQPSCKTIYVRSSTEEEAVRKADEYVRETRYNDIQDKKIL